MEEREGDGEVRIKAKAGGRRVWMYFQPESATS